jgi:hypothetical protein
MNGIKYEILIVGLEDERSVKKFYLLLKVNLSPLCI